MHTNYNLLDEYLKDHQKLYVTTVSDDLAIVWRLLNIDECKKLIGIYQRGIFDQYSFFYMIFERCYQGNPNVLADVPFGLLCSIGEFIFSNSASSSVQEEKELLTLNRNMYQADSFVEYMKRTIYIAFREIKYKEISKLTKYELFELFVRAEAILQQQTGYTPVDLDKIVTSEELNKQQTKKQFIDFEKENAELGAQGAFDAGSSPAELPLFELHNRQQKTKYLEKQRARALDNKIKGR